MEANLLEAISIQDAQEKSAGTFKRASLRGIVVYGRVRCVIKRPCVLPDNIEDGDGYFCIVDVYALKCLEEDYFKKGCDYDINHLYFTRGNLVAYIKDPDKWVGRDVRILGKSYGSNVYGCTIRRQGTSDTSGITAFEFKFKCKEGRRTIYTLVCNKVEELAVGSRDCRGTVLEEFMVKLASSKNNEIPYSKSLYSIIPFTGVENYSEISIKPDDTNEGTCSNTTVSDQNQTSPMAFIPSKGSDGRLDLSNIDMHLVYHLEGKARSPYCDSFSVDINRCGDSRSIWVSETLKAIGSMIDSVDPDINELRNQIRNGFISNIAGNYMGVIGTSRCRDYVNRFISNCEDTTFSTSRNDSPQEMLKRIREGCEELKRLVATDPSCLMGNGSSIDFIPAIWDISIFCLNAISVCTGIPYDSILSCYRYMNRNFDIHVHDFLPYLVCTPYFLGLVSCGLSLADCDCIYYGVSKNYECIMEFDSYNSVHRSYMVMLNTLRSVCDGTNPVCRSRSGGANTFVPIKVYTSAVMHYDKRYRYNVENFGYPRGLDSISCLKKIFENKTLGISKNDTKKLFSEDNSWFSSDSLSELEEIGAINTLEGFIALEGRIEQEYRIYSVFEGMGKQETGISEDKIMATVDSFEKSRGFKLEKLQRDGVKLCMKRAGVLSGCAGSGKTTTSDCLTEVLRKYLPDMHIIYCTPTGKACRRLAEVVGGTVKTIHSQFHIGLGGDILIPQSYVDSTKDEKKGSGTIYIMDEMAMCSTELMFNVAKNITKNDMIFFLGDIKQLPPVGNGCPFKVLMDLLPCVELGVSKRAAAGSLVNYNTTLINFMSEGIPTPLLFDDKTFIANPCSNANIVLNTVSAFEKFMDGSMNGTKYSEDDIQVISGYQKDTKASSIVNINPALQSVLRKDSRLLFVREKRNGDSRNYYLGDRVIYINSNSYDICRYIPSGSNRFKPVITLGIVNGDVGKVVGVLHADEIEFDEFDRADYVEGAPLRGELTDSEVTDLLYRRDERSDTIRKDEAYRGKDLYFVVIQLYDTDLKRDVLVFLRARGKMVDSVLALSGGDLDNLDLAYALTCHKMQGSQSPVVIIPLEKGSYPGFINRNMINTMVTRSQGIVCLIGDIIGNDSALSSGRRCVSSTSSHDLLSVLTDNCGWLDDEN